MGLFRKKNPFWDLSQLSDFAIMHSKFDEVHEPFIFFPKVSTKNHLSVDFLELTTSDLNSEFQDLLSQLLQKYNSLFKPGTESPRPGGDEFVLQGWPNFYILNSIHPFRIIQDSNYQDGSGNTAPHNFQRKEFSFFVFIDSESVGKLHICTKAGSQLEFLEIFDLNLKVDSETYFSLWSLCASDPNVKSGLFVRAKFEAGSTDIDELFCVVPKPFEAAAISWYLKKAKFK
jgi:hypothetical protein